jgi:hypothetical protein
MDNRVYYKYQNYVSKWLLAAVLFLSLLISPGSGLQRQVKAVGLQTTSVSGTSNPIVKGISFNTARRYARTSYPRFSLLIEPDINLINLHSRNLNIQLKNHHGAGYTGQQSCFFYRLKTIPQSTGDDPLSFLG